MRFDRQHMKVVPVWYGKPRFGLSFGPSRTLPGEHPENLMTPSALLCMSIKWG